MNYRISHIVAGAAGGYAVFLGGLYAVARVHIPYGLQLFAHDVRAEPPGDPFFNSLVDAVEAAFGAGILALGIGLVYAAARNRVWVFPFGVILGVISGAFALVLADGVTHWGWVRLGRQEVALFACASVLGLAAAFLNAAPGKTEGHLAMK